MPVNRSPGAEDVEDVVTLGPWEKGMDNLHRDTELEGGAVLRNAVNVDISQDGTLRRRPGRASRIAGDVHSVWSDEDQTILLVVVINALKKITVDPTTGTLTQTTLRSGLAALPLTYTAVNGEVYYSNGAITGKVVNGTAVPWGVESPAALPVLTATAGGGFFAGTYQVVLTYATASGEESGAGSGVDVTLAAGQAITVSGIPQPVDPSVTRIRIYLTSTNGEVFYLHTEYAVGTTSAVLSQSTTPGQRLQTQFLVPPPPGQAIEFFNGRIWIAQGPVLWYTEPLRYGLIHLDNYIPFPAEIDIVAAATTGIYVAADRHYYLPGGDPSKMALVEKLPFGAVRGTLARLPYSQSHIGSRRASKLAATKESGTVWMSARGLVIANEQGDIRVVSEDQIVTNPNTRGAALVRETNGIRQIITTGFGADGVTSGLVAQDYLDAEVIRKTP